MLPFSVQLNNLSDICPFINRKQTNIHTIIYSHLRVIIYMPRQPGFRSRTAKKSPAPILRWGHGHLCDKANFLFSAPILQPGSRSPVRSGGFSISSACPAAAITVTCAMKKKCPPGIQRIRNHKNTFHLSFSGAVYTYGKNRSSQAQHVFGRHRYP